MYGSAMYGLCVVVLFMDHVWWCYEWNMCGSAMYGLCVVVLFMDHVW